MEHVEYVYTEGLTEEAVDHRLRDRGHGVVALADGAESYAVPINYVYEDSRLLLRMSEEAGSEKVAFAESTETATLVVYDVDEEGSWSVLLRGPIRRLSANEQAAFTDRWINERFPPFRLFDEDVEDVEMVFYELEVVERVGRRTVGRE